MRINWWVRFHNKTFLASFLALVIAFVYNLLALFGVTPTVQQDALLTAVNAILTVLGMIGVIADPTTKGISDSAQAMTYDKPKEG
jgi:phi LC3 family holin|nr:MAG TPA: holin [Caudoviricetes sp.]